MTSMFCSFDPRIATPETLAVSVEKMVVENEGGKRCNSEKQALPAITKQLLL